MIDEKCTACAGTMILINDEESLCNQIWWCVECGSLAFFETNIGDPYMDTNGEWSWIHPCDKQDRAEIEENEEREL